MTELPNKQFFRPDELAAKFGVNTETVRRWIRDERVRHIHGPKGIFIPASEFEWILEHGPRPRPSSTK